MTSAERRRSHRIGLTIAVRVQGFLVGGKPWDEVTQTDEVSGSGASVVLKHPVELGQILYMTLALPKRLRQHDLDETTYRVYTLVRGISHRPEDSRVGVMFFGKVPPRGFDERPWARFLLPSDSSPPEAPPEAARPEAPPTPPFPLRVGRGDTPPLSRDPVAERRAQPRVQVFVNFTIQQVDEWGVVLQEELTVADNVSKGGAHVLTSLAFAKGDVVLLQEASGDFATRAEICRIVVGADAITRLHLKFLVQEAPDRLLRA